MLINWFTVVAQIINFLVLVLLLKRFLYKPIIKAMQAREAKIGQLLAEAGRKKQEAEAEAAAYQQEKQEINRDRQNMLAQAEEEAKVHRRKLLAQACQEVEQLRRQWYNSIEQEKNAFELELRQRIADQVWEIARLGLQELGNAELDNHLVAVFLQRLRTLSEAEKREIFTNVLKDGKEVVIASAFALPEEARGRIIDTVSQAIAEGLTVRYEIVPELLAGIELKASGHKVAWSLENYLESLEENLSEVFSRQGGRAPQD